MHPLEHLRTLRVLDAWVDGELDTEDAARAERHVHRCRRCHAAAEAARAIKQSLQRHNERRPPALAVSRLRRFAESLPLY